MALYSKEKMKSMQLNLITIKLAMIILLQFMS